MLIKNLQSLYNPPCTKTMGGRYQGMGLCLSPLHLPIAPENCKITEHRSAVRAGLCS